MRVLKTQQMFCPKMNAKSEAKISPYQTSNFKGFIFSYYWIGLVY